MSRTYLNYAAAAALCLVVAGAPACKRASSSSDDTETETDSETGMDVGAVVDSETGEDSETDSESALNECSETELAAEGIRLNQMISGGCTRSPGIDGLVLIIGTDGMVLSVAVPDVSTEDLDVSAFIACYQELLEGEEFPCLAGERYGAPCLRLRGLLERLFDGGSFLEKESHDVLRNLL